MLEFGERGRLVVGIVSYINKSTGKVCWLENNRFKSRNYYDLDTINPHPASREKRDALMKAMNDAGYVWDVEKKELRRLIKHKFDPKTLQPFDKVLVRDYNTEKWECDFFSHTIESGVYKYATIKCVFRQCIPYNDDTKHLVCTTEEAPEFYRYWEE